MSGYGGFYGPKYTPSVVTRIARLLEDAGLQLSWNELLRLARECESIVRSKEQARYRDWRDE